MKKGDATEAPREVSCGPLLPGQRAQTGTQHLRVPMHRHYQPEVSLWLRCPVLSCRDTGQSWLSMEHSASVSSCSLPSIPPLWAAWAKFTAHPGHGV